MSTRGAGGGDTTKLFLEPKTFNVEIQNKGLAIVD